MCFLCICVFSSDVFLLCSTFVFFFGDDIVQQRPVHAICNLIPISSPTPPLSLRVSTTPPNVKTRSTFSGIEQNNMRGVLGYLFTSDSVDRQVDHRIYESDNTTEALMHTTPLKKGLTRCQNEKHTHTKRLNNLWNCFWSTSPTSSLVHKMIAYISHPMVLHGVQI